MSSPDEPYDVNVRQAAEILGVHENTVRNWAKSGRLPSWEMPGSGFHRFRRSVLEAIRKAMDEGPSYHDLHITTDKIPRISIFNLPYSFEVKCNRVAGWEVWDSSQETWRLLGGEYNAEAGECEEGRPITGGLRLDVAGFVIVDSLTPPEPEPGQAYRLGDVADIRFAGGERRAVFMPKYVPAGYPRQDAWVWPEGHVLAGDVQEVHLAAGLGRDDRG